MKRITTERIFEYCERLQSQMKIKKLGAGAFGTVFKHPTDENIVVKVFDSQKDTGYAKYLKWCLKNQNNPYVPKIFGIEKFHSEGPLRHQTINVVFLEKLKRARYNDLNKLIEKKCGIKSSWDIDWNMVRSNTHDEHLKRIAKLFDKADFSVDYGLDLHEDNYMIRPSTKQLVFTDPFA